MRSGRNHHADLAEAAAIVLASEESFDGAAPPLTASAAVDLEGVAGMLSDLSGRTIRRVVADDDAWTAGMIERGVPAAGAQGLLGMFRASRRGEFAIVDPTLARLLGREPTSLRSVLQGVVTSGAQTTQ